MATLKNGSDGAEVKALQDNLTKLGFAIQSDGKFGPATEEAVRQLQKAFGYTVDGVVGDATLKLVTQQLGYGWKFNK